MLQPSARVVLSARGPERGQGLRHPHAGVRLVRVSGSRAAYCFSCGDVSLGGFVVDRANRRGEGDGVVIGSANVGVVSAEAPPVFRRLYGDYVWFWPGDRPIEADPSWTKTTPESKKTVAFSFAPARLDPAVGLISPALDDGNGWVLKVDAHEDGAKIPALPDRCPRCDSEGWNPGDKFFAGTVRSPIRAHTSGAAQSTQLVPLAAGQKHG